MQGGTLSVPGSDNEVLMPYRWYVVSGQMASRELHLSINGEESTGISTTPQADSRGLNVYTLSGRKIGIRSEEGLESLPKGVYLVNNKKRIVK